MLATAGAGIFLLLVRATSIDASSFLQANAARGAPKHNSSKAPSESAAAASSPDAVPVAPEAKRQGHEARSEDSVEKYTVVHYTDTTCTERAGTEDQFSPSRVPDCYNVVTGELQGGSFKVTCPKEDLEEVNQFIYQASNCKGEEMDKKRLKWVFFEGQCSKKLVMKPVMKWRDLPACKTKALAAVGVTKKYHPAEFDVTDILAGKHVAGKSKRTNKVEEDETNLTKDTARARRHHGNPSEKDWEELIEEKARLSEAKAKLAAEKAAEQARMAAKKAQQAQISKDSAQAAGKSTGEDSAQAAGKSTGEDSAQAAGKSTEEDKADQAWQKALERVQAAEKSKQDTVEDADARGAQDDLDKFVGEGLKAIESGKDVAVAEAFAHPRGRRGPQGRAEATGAEAGSNATRGGESGSSQRKDGGRVLAVENSSATDPDDVHEDAHRDPRTAAPSSAHLAAAHKEDAKRKPATAAHSSAHQADVQKDAGVEEHVQWRIKVADQANVEPRRERPKTKLLKAKVRQSASPKPPTRTQGLALFDEIDSDQSGTMSSRELSDALDSDHIKHHFEHFQLNVTDAQDFFDGMDVDGDRKVDANEFISGCEHFLAEELARRNKELPAPHKGSHSQ